MRKRRGPCKVYVYQAMTGDLQLEYTRRSWNFRRPSHHIRRQDRNDYDERRQQEAGLRRRV